MLQNNLNVTSKMNLPVRKSDTTFCLASEQPTFQFFYQLQFKLVKKFINSIQV